MQDKSQQVGSHAFSVLMDLAAKDIALKAEDFPGKKDDILEKYYSWITIEEEKIKLLGIVSSLGSEIKKKEDIGKVGVLVEALDSPYQAVRQLAIERLNGLAKKAFAYKADASDQDRIQAIKEVEAWYKECKEKWEQK